MYKYAAVIMLLIEVGNLHASEQKQLRSKRILIAAARQKQEESKESPQPTTQTLASFDDNTLLVGEVPSIANRQPRQSSAAAKYTIEEGDDGDEGFKYLENLLAEESKKEARQATKPSNYKRDQSLAVVPEASQPTSLHRQKQAPWWVCCAKTSN